MSFYTVLGTVTESISDALTTGSDTEAMLALSLVAAVSVIAFTLIRKPYCFSVGYGMSVAIMSLTMLAVFDCFRGDKLSATAMLAWTAVLYGFRLAAYLLFREFSVPNMRSQTKTMDKYSRPSVLALAAFLSLFYAFQVSPVLFALRQTSSSSGMMIENLRYMCVIYALTGFIMEAVADYQKWIVKRRQKVEYGGTSFISPTGGLYAICRHPNFLGETIFWTGIFFGGALSFGYSVTAWICGLIGWSGIFFIMTGSAKRLDAKHEERYAGQLEYEEWKNRVKSSFYPGFPRLLEQYPVYHQPPTHEPPTLIEADEVHRRDKVMLVGATGSLGKDIVTELRRNNVHLRVLGRSWDSVEKAGLTEMLNVDVAVCDVTKAESYTADWFTDVECLVCVARPRFPSTPHERMAFFALVDNLSRMACECRVPRMLLLGTPYMKGRPLMETKIMNLFRQAEALAISRTSDSRATELTIARISDMTEADYLLQASLDIGTWVCIKGFNPRMRFISRRDFALVVANYTNDEDTTVEPELLVGGPQLVTWRELGELISNATGKQFSTIDIPLWLLRSILLLARGVALFFPSLGTFAGVLATGSIPMMLETTSDKHKVIGSDTIGDSLKAYYHRKQLALSKEGGGN